MRIYRAWSLFLVLSMTVHLADTRPHSPATLAYKSITHTPFIGSTHANLPIAEPAMHRHVRIAFFRSLFVHLAHRKPRFLIAFWLAPMTL